jgi:hypothetical protein
MPSIAEPMSISSVAGQTQQRLLRHDFVGGNFLIQSLFSRFGPELHTDVAPSEFELAAARTREHLGRDAAQLHLDVAAPSEGRFLARVTVTNLTGHKLPTAYPSRRAWLHFTARTANGAVVFESGALRGDGSIVGNDNDTDPTRFEAHHARIEHASDVAIYESILGQSDRRVTTGLLAATQYLKDNRLLPLGFDKAKAHTDVAVHGGAAQDPDFQGGYDSVVYEVLVGDAPGPFKIEVELLYQPVGFRWAENLRRFAAFEPQRFVRYYEALSQRSTTVLAAAQGLSKIGPIESPFQVADENSTNAKGIR